MDAAPADYLSVRRNRGIDAYKLKAGMILQSCSGRNLGPAVIVDRYLEQFLIGDDMLRIEIADENLRYYTLAFLKSSLAQALLRQGKTGSVIDHISIMHVASIQIPLLSGIEFRAVSGAMRDACELKEKARLTLADAEMQYEASLPALNRMIPMASGWTIKSRKLTGRLDAASYDPLVSKVRKALLDAGGKPVKEVADALKTPGRYKRYYVSREHGTPILSGTQLLQHTPINLQFLAPRAVSNPKIFELKDGWIAYQAEGRAEETLGLPIVVSPDRRGWFANNHVGRLVPKAGVSGGWLYTALRTPHCQTQIKSLASGSVVDSTFPSDMETVILPPTAPGFEWSRVDEAWRDFAQVSNLENKSVRLLEKHLSEPELRLT